MAAFPGFVGPAFTSRFTDFDCEDLYNWYPRLGESPNTKSRMALFPTPGLRVRATNTLSPVRQLFHQDDRTFCVLGHGFFELNTSNWVLTQRGTIAKDGNPATICSSGGGGNQLFITSGGLGYIYDLLSDSLSSPISGLTATMGAFLDGFFIALDVDSQRIRISGYYDGNTWDALQYRVRAVASDKWVSMAVVHGEIWLFGNQTYEVWYNNGASPFPFAPIQGILYNQGNGAAYSMSTLGESVAWMSANQQGTGMVHLSDQYAPKRISNEAVETSLQSMARSGVSISDGVGFTYQEDGNLFYVLGFDQADITWVYDHTTSTQLGYPVWHKRALWNTASHATPAHWQAWGPRYHCYANGYHLVGDRDAGIIWSMGVNEYTDEYGLALRRVRRAPHLFNEKKIVIYSQLELDLQVGIGTSSGQGRNPIVGMRYSNDGGKTWGNERTTTAGRMGKYSTRVQFQKLGRSRDRVFEISVTDPNPWGLVNAYLDSRPGIR